MPKLVGVNSYERTLFLAVEALGAMPLLERFRRVRAQTERLSLPLSPEDMLVQSMPDASPTKWHLAHTTWFFAEFALSRSGVRHLWPDERWRVLFNSYYAGVGASHSRAARGVLSRPSFSEIQQWRGRVDAEVAELIERADSEALAVVLIGTHHEQQHQELLLSDAKHALWQNPLRPAYAVPNPRQRVEATSLQWLSVGESIANIGDDSQEFAFDNERPRHRACVGSFQLGSRLVTNAEYRAFIADRGYDRPELWLADGYGACSGSGVRTPLYWGADRDDDELAFTLAGNARLHPEAPVTHVSFFEADAYARWAGARLPTEEEWEIVASECPLEGNFVESGRLEPAPAPAGAGGVQQLFGDVWEWTASAFLPYPRFRPLEGPLGEYNGKFMNGQRVLRGGSCWSSRDHLRATYRNFFPPAARWQATGIRLARDEERAHRQPK